MADFDPRIMTEFNRVLDDYTRTFGGGHSGFGRGKPAPSPHKTSAARDINEFKKNLGSLNAPLKQTHNLFKRMHGSIDDVVHGLNSFAKMFVGGEIATAMFKGALNLGNTYSKLSDIGETFGGSMFDMAQQAGASGLSLDEFAKMLEKNSTAAAVLNERQGQSANAMGQLQLAVRNNLKDMGFYGMTLTQVTDTTSDFAESMRLTGQLDRTNQTQQSAAITSMIGSVTAFSDATGKSRQEILKGVNAAYRETSAAMRMTAEGLGEGQQKAYSTFVSFFSSLPGIAGEQLPKFFAQAYGVGGNLFFTDMGKMFIKAGLGDVGATMSHMVEQMQGANASTTDMVNSTLEMRDSILRRQGTLQALANAGNQEASEALAFAESLNGLSREELTKRINDAKQAETQRKFMDKYTKDVMLFESNFHMLTGRFRDGFYQAFGTLIKTFDPDKNDALWNFLYGAKNGQGILTGGVMNRLGEAFGTLLGKVLSPENLDFIGKQLDMFAAWLEQIATQTDFVNKVISLEKAIEDIIVGFGKLLGWLHSAIAFFIGSGKATLVEGGLLYILSKLLRGFFSRLFTRQVVIYTSSVTGPGAGSGFGGGFGGGRGGGAPAAGAGGVRGFLGRVAGSRLWGISGGIAGSLVGYAGGLLIDKVIDQFGDFTGKGALEDVIDMGSSIGLGLAGQKFGSWIARSVASRLAAGAAANVAATVEPWMIGATTSAAGAAAGGLGVGGALAAGAAGAGFLAAGALGAYLAYKSGTHAANLGEYAAQKGFSAVSAMDENGLPTEYKNPETGERMPALTLDDQFRASKKDAPPTAPTTGAATEPNDSVSSDDLNKKLDAVNAQMVADEKARSTATDNDQLIKIGNDLIALLKEKLDIQNALQHKNNNLTEDQVRGNDWRTLFQN